MLQYISWLLANHRSREAMTILEALCALEGSK